jgi:hypothetical protein
MTVSLKYAHLCDYAVLGQNAKPILVGIFDQLAPAPDAPLQLPLSFFVMALQASIADGPTHTIAIVVRDEDEAEVWRGDIGVIPFAPSGPGRPLQVLVIMGVTGLGFPRRCDYQFEVFVDNAKIGQVPFYVVDPPPS